MFLFDLVFSTPRALEPTGSRQRQREEATGRPHSSDGDSAQGPDEDS